MTDAPDSQVPSTEAAFKPKRGRALAGLAAVGVVIAAGAGLLLWRADVDAREREAVAWGKLTRCLVGDAPAGQKPSLKARKIQLRAVAEPYENRPTTEGEAWPSRCASPAIALKETFKDTGRLDRDGAELAKGAEALGKKLKENAKPSIDIFDTLDRLWDEAAKLNLAPKAGAEVKAPPEAVETLDLDTLAQTPPLAKAAFALDTVFSERVPATVLRVIATSKDLPDAPLVCTFPEGAPSGHCEKPPAPVLAASKDLRLLGSTDDEAKPLYFADKRGDGGIFRGDTGEKVSTSFSYGGFTRKDGFVTALGWDDKTDSKKPFVLARARAGAAPKEDRFMLEGFAYALNDVGLLWDQMVWENLDRKTGERHLFAKKIDETNDPTKDATDVGKLHDYDRVENYERAEETIRGCKTKDALAVLVKGRYQDSVAFNLGDRWIAPLEMGGTGGTLTCRGTEATETRVDPLRGDAAWKEQIRQDRCTPAGCLAKHVGVSDLLHGLRELQPGDQRTLAAVDLDGKLLVVWIAGAMGGVRMKMAPIDQIAGAPDTVLLDDMTRGGQVQKGRQLNDIRLFARPGYAVLLLGSAAGVHAMRIDPSGKATPIPMK